MAERRMFSKKVINSARFLRMPATSRLLYYDLGMQADDDGIVEAFAIMRMVGANEDDLRVLEARGFVKVLNEDLVTYIIDWKKNNTIRKDRYTPSEYAYLLEETLSHTDTQMTTNGCQIDNQLSVSMETQSRSDQVRLDQVRTEQVRSTQDNRVDELTQHFVSRFGQNPTPKLQSAFQQALETGLNFGDVRQAIDDAASRAPRNPSAYTLAILLNFVQNGGAPNLSSENQEFHEADPLQAWEVDWLSEFKSMSAQSPATHG